MSQLSDRTQIAALAVLLSIVLFSCAGNLQPDRTRPISPALTAAPSIFYLDKSALAYGVFETEATSLTLDISNTVPEQFQDFADISVQDGTGITTYEIEPGESTIVHNMPAGKKRVVITSGAQTKFNGEIVGIFINKITFAGSATQIEQDNKRLLVYGDSLAIGGNVNHLSAEAWPVLLREHYSVRVEAYGYRALYDDVSAEARSELASNISSWMPDDIWLAIGGNDYAFELWPAQEFGKAYAEMLDTMHSASPRATLFAQSPILRADEPANVFGDILEKYRQQIETACLARVPWCIFVDGTNPAFPQPEELDKDGLHLTTQSSAKYAQAVLNTIGK